MRSLFVTVALFALATAERFVVSVGQDSGLTYDPPSVAAKVGDTVAFRFVSKNHTVTQSSFANPCARLSNGTDSGYVPVPPGSATIPEWSITLDSTDPLWFFCAQARHCQSGMVFALNPTADKTFDTFKATAMSAQNATTGTTVPSASSTAGADPSQGTSSDAQDSGALSITGHRHIALLAALGLAAGFLL